MKITAPQPDEYPAYYAAYVRLAATDDLMSRLAQSGEEIARLIQGIPADKADFAYAPGKWTLKEVLMHINDAERIFSYRALCFARNDRTPLPGFDEQAYALYMEASTRSLADIAEEFVAIRKATVTLFTSFTPDMLSRQGVANQVAVSVRAIGHIIVGHAWHHAEVIRQRYLNVT